MKKEQDPMPNTIEPVLKKELPTDSAEKILSKISENLAKLNSEETADQFDSVGFTKDMRQIKVYLCNSMAVQGLSLREGSGGDTRWHPIFKEIALNLFQSIVLASAQSNYELQFNATIELHDLLRSLD